MIATLLVAFRFFPGAADSATVIVAKARVSTTAPLALGIFNSAISPSAITGVASVRITQSMA